MKKIILPFLFLLFLQSLSAQQGQPIPDETYGEGGYRIESEKTNVNDERESHVEYFDKGRNKKKRETITFKKDGTTVKTTVWFDCEGGIIAKRELKRDKLGNEIEDISENYDKKTKEVISGYRYVMENGQMKLYVFDEETGTYVPSRLNERPINFTDALGLEKQCCIPRHNLFPGYSFLNATGENGESFPIGAHLFYTYLLTQSIGLVGDMSIHSKKEEDLRITRAFLMGGLQYNIIKQRQKALLLYIRLLAGLACDRQKYLDEEANKASAFAVAAGMGLSFRINKMIRLSLVPDYIRTFYNSESQGNIRASAGVQINLGCK